MTGRERDPEDDLSLEQLYKNMHEYIFATERLIESRAKRKANKERLLSGGRKAKARKMRLRRGDEQNMDSFQNLTRMDRRKFLAGFLATAASAGVLVKLGVDDTYYDYTVWIQNGDLTALFYRAGFVVGRAKAQPLDDGAYGVIVPEHLVSAGVVRMIGIG